MEMCGLSDDKSKLLERAINFGVGVDVQDDDRTPSGRLNFNYNVSKYNVPPAELRLECK